MFKNTSSVLFRVQIITKKLLLVILLFLMWFSLAQAKFVTNYNFYELFLSSLSVCYTSVLLSLNASSGRRMSLDIEKRCNGELLLLLFTFCVSGQFISMNDIL